MGTRVYQSLRVFSFILIDFQGVNSRAQPFGYEYRKIYPCSAHPKADAGHALLGRLFMMALGHGHAAFVIIGFINRRPFQRGQFILYDQ